MFVVLHVFRMGVMHDVWFEISVVVALLWILTVTNSVMHGAMMCGTHEANGSTNWWDRTAFGPGIKQFN